MLRKIEELIEKILKEPFLPLTKGANAFHALALDFIKFLNVIKALKKEINY